MLDLFKKSTKKKPSEFNSEDSISWGLCQNTESAFTFTYNPCQKPVRLNLLHKDNFTYKVVDSEIFKQVLNNFISYGNDLQTMKELKKKVGIDGEE